MAGSVPVSGGFILHTAPRAPNHALAGMDRNHDGIHALRQEHDEARKVVVLAMEAGPLQWLGI